MDLVNAMVEHHAWLVGEMIERASSLREEQLDAPIEISVKGIDDHPTIRSLLSRLVGQMAMWNATLDRRPYDFDVEHGETLESMRTRLAIEGSTFLGTVRTGGEEDLLDDTFVDATCDPREVFTHGGMIAHVLPFAAHRRTLVAGALIDAGISDLGAGDPVHWVAER
ncbi:hypothetical protein BH18ACT17_BH18ACT17_01720 [soil metagenome]